MGRKTAKSVALGGMMAALAVVIMCMGGIIPMATYVCPMLCSLLLAVVLRLTGRRIAWVWYAAVSILSLLMGPDKEAACVFLLLGYYPIVKPSIDRSRLRWIWKLLLFNSAIAVLYLGLIHLLGLNEALAEAEELGKWGLVVMLLLGNVTFVLLDYVLNMIALKLRRK